jgi:succinate dehydrogenase assembly factor 1
MAIPIGTSAMSVGVPSLRDAEQSCDEEEGSRSRGCKDSDVASRHSHSQSGRHLQVGTCGVPAKTVVVNWGNPRTALSIKYIHVHLQIYTSSLTTSQPGPIPSQTASIGRVSALFPGTITTGMARLSGLQRDVLSLYRQCLRAARNKPADTRPNFESFARKEFEQHVHVDKKDFGAIEFFLRKGHRQLETYSSAGITNIAG